MSLSRETRLNLIVLAVLAVLLTPGAVVLVRKQMSAASRSEFLRDPVRVEAAYLDPVDLPAHIRRVVPGPVKAWLRTLPESSGRAGAIRTWHEGLVSLRRRFEVVAVEPISPGSWRLYAASWDTDMTLAGRDVAFHWENGTAAIASMRAVDVPPQVREALQDAGWTMPPRQVGWLEIALQQRVPGDGADRTLHELTLEAEYETRQGRLVEPATVPVPAQTP